MDPLVEVIPSSELPGLPTALGDIEQLTAQLAPYREKANTLEVKWPDREAYASIGEVLSYVTNSQKQGEAIVSPFDLIVDRVRTFLRTRKQRHTNACEEIKAVCRWKMKVFEHKELEEKQAEQDRINKQNAKKGLPEVTVQAAIPSVAGYRRSTNYYAESTDFDMLLRGWANRTGKEKQYLRKFIMIDAKALNAEARNVKDPEKLMKMIPGIRAWKD